MGKVYFILLGRLKSILGNINNSFQCYKCGVCCENLFNNSIVMFPSDVNRIHKEMKIEKKEFLTRYCVHKDISYGNSSIRVFFMKVEKNRKCVFLNNNLCTIYNIRPIQCKKTPYNFFPYSKLWEYMPCVNREQYIKRNSYTEDMELIKELLKGY